MWQGSYKFVVNQWGVGHGGFHSQSLFFQALDRNPTARVGNGTLVRVIYDCGSGRTTRPRKALTDAVGRMLSDVADGSTIDLLVISHFDRDHVNGLDHLAAKLVKKQIQVARVWAPVLTKIEADSSAGGTGNRHPHKKVLVELGNRNLNVHAATDGIDFSWSDKRIR